MINYEKLAVVVIIMQAVNSGVVHYKDALRIAVEELRKVT